MGLESEYANCKTLYVLPPVGYDTQESNVPVMVRIGRSAGKYRDDTSDVFEKLGASYQKMAISLDDGVTECPVEVKDWDVTRQLGILFVKIPSVPTTGMTLKLWYDPTHADNPNVGAVGSAAGQSVWSNEFAGVWHTPSGGLLLDSSPNGNHGTIYGATETTGPLGKCLSFDGVDDKIVIPHSVSMHPDQTFSFDCYFQTPKSGEFQWLFAKGLRGAVVVEYPVLIHVTSSQKEQIYVKDASQTPVLITSEGIVPIDAYTFLSATLDGEQVKAYLGGGLDGQGDWTGNNIYPSTVDWYIGHGDNSLRWFKGEIALITWSKSVARSPAWIALQNASLKDELIAFSEPGTESLSGTERMRLTPDGTLIANEFVED